MLRTLVSERTLAQEEQVFSLVGFPWWAFFFIAGANCGVEEMLGWSQNENPGHEIFIVHNKEEGGRLLRSRRRRYRRNRSFGRGCTFPDTAVPRVAELVLEVEGRFRVRGVVGWRGNCTNKGEGKSCMCANVYYIRITYVVYLRKTYMPLYVARS